MKKLLFIILGIFILIFFISCLTTFVTYSGYSFTTNSSDNYFSTTEFTWPLPEYHLISSDFGFRISPTTGNHHYHSGIDIPAPERYKYIFCFMWCCYIFRIQWSKWLYNYDKK